MYVLDHLCCRLLCPTFHVESKSNGGLIFWSFQTSFYPKYIVILLANKCLEVCCLSGSITINYPFINQSKVQEGREFASFLDIILTSELLNSCLDTTLVRTSSKVFHIWTSFVLSSNFSPHIYYNHVESHIFITLTINLHMLYTNWRLVRVHRNSRTTTAFLQCCISTIVTTT